MENVIKDYIKALMLMIEETAKLKAVKLDQPMPEVISGVADFFWTKAFISAGTFNEKEELGLSIQGEALGDEEDNGKESSLRVDPELTKISSDLLRQQLGRLYPRSEHHSPTGCLEEKEDEWETLEDDWYKE